MHHPSPDPSKVLLIKAKGGFGNRMLSAVTGLVYADLTGRTPVIDWRDGVYAALGENAYPLLFDTPLTGDPAAYDAARDVVPAIWAGQMEADPSHIIETTMKHRHSDPRVYREFCVALERAETETAVAVFWSYLPKMPRLRRLLRRDARFAGRSDREIFTEYLERYFRPNARVRMEVARLLEEMAPPRLGVHIRYTDMKVPLERIEQAMGRWLAAHPGASIFLATDSAMVQERIQAGFERVHVAPKYLAEDGVRLHLRDAGGDAVFEAENAMIDMWALAGCDHLIYSSQSTFSSASALLGGLRRDQLHDVDRFNLAVQLKLILRNRL
ncbi:hypothetical protein [Primorskyibacter sp. S187A]|uniref:hypothetical protein n=1 Tax=Primorskyibacter sp. S187A TaxID=3415130 RepID=UPI003C7D4019